MRSSRVLLTAVAGFVVFVPITFVWHTVLFSSYYLGPQLSVKSADAFDARFIIAANAVLVLTLAIVLPRLTPQRRRALSGAGLGALFASLLVDYHNLQLMGLFPGQDPLSLYAMDALWAIVDGALTGIAMTLTYDAVPRPAPSGVQVARV